MKYNIPMRRARIFLILGIWITLLPYLGFPYSWKDILTTLSGLGLIGMSYLLYRELKTKEIKKEKTFDNFSENEFKEEGEINDQIL
jgi:hypothetical protein